MDYISEKKINEVQNMIREMDIKDYPEFDVDKNIDLLKIFPFHHEASMEKSQEYIDISSIVGDNWAFNKVEDRGNYPRRMKLMNILDYYKGVKHRGQDLPPVDIVSINGVYHLSEGNHRLYVLKWLESLGVIKKPLIKANIEKYDYNHFIQNVSFVQRKFGGEIISYMKFPNDYIEPLDNETYERLLELKKLNT